MVKHFTLFLAITCIHSNFAGTPRRNPNLLPIPNGEGRSIVLIGDSILDNDFQRYKMNPTNHVYQRYLGIERLTFTAALKNNGFNVFNLAKYGSKLENVEMQQLPVLQKTRKKFQMAVVSIGGNNLGHSVLNPIRLAQEIHTARGRLEVIIREVAKKADHVILLTPPDVWHLKPFLGWFFDIAEAGKVETLKNVGQVTVFHIPEICPGDVLPDGLHPSPQCYDALYQKIALLAMEKTEFPRLPQPQPQVQLAKPAQTNNILNKIIAWFQNPCL